MSVRVYWIGINLLLFCLFLHFSIRTPAKQCKSTDDQNSSKNGWQGQTLSTRFKSIEYGNKEDCEPGKISLQDNGIISDSQCRYGRQDRTSKGYKHEK